MSGMEREPCPWRVVDDAGGAFVFGLAGGTVWNFFGGLRNAPKGQRMIQMLARVKARTPITAGGFAVWGAVFSLCDCSFTYLRKKEDPWNAIMSGAMTGGLLAARAGPRQAAQNAAIGGVLLAAIEGLNIVVQRVIMPMIEKQQSDSGVAIDLLEPPRDPFYSRGRSSSSTPLWDPSASPQTLPSTGNAGSFDLESVADFDHQADDWQERKKREEEEAKAEKSAKPFWKVW